MSESFQAAVPAAPVHVPADMIRNYELYYLAGNGKDTFSFLRSVHADRDIFYNLTADRIICPNGTWCVSSFKLMAEVLQDPVTFSSHDIVQYSRLIDESWDMIPLELDGSDHMRIRAVVVPMFSPARVKLLQERITLRAEELIEVFRRRGNCEFVAEFANVFPVSIFLELIDLPQERYGDFLNWAEGITHSYDPQHRKEATFAARSYLGGIIEQRRKNPGEDILSKMFQATPPDGKPLTDTEFVGLAFMLFVGGLDTVAATLGFAFRYLADNPEACRKLKADPQLIPTAVEEFLRAFSVVQTKRKVTVDTNFHGAPLKAGDFVTCVTGLAGTDPSEYGEGVVIDRSANRHIAFGLGPHRCLGSHLARLELKLALEVWLRLIPEFSVAPGARLTTHGAGGVYGYDQLPLVWPVPTGS